MPSMARLDPFSSPVLHDIARMEELYRGSSPDYEFPAYRNGNNVTKSIQAIGPGPVRNMTPSTKSFTTRGTFRERYERVKRFDEERNSLLEELLKEVEDTRDQLEQLRLDHETETRYHRERQKRETDSIRELQVIRTLIDRNSYVTVLIDGDSLTLHPQYLAKGEEGGALAAEALVKRITNFLSENMPSIQNYQIHVRCYAQLAELAKALITAKLVLDDAVLEDFWHGFGHKNILFDLVDTRITKTTTVEKLKERYLSDFLNVHCQQVLLATVASKDYESLFESIPGIQTHERVTLIEAAGLRENERFDYPIQSISASDLFVKTPMEGSPSACVTKTAVPPPTKVAAPRLTRVESNGSSMTYKTAATNPTSGPSTPHLTWAAMTAQPFVPSAASISRTGTPANPANPTKPSQVTTKFSTASIQRNKYGQRIDAVDKSIEYKDLTRIKQLKLCNIHYLQGTGFCEGKCGHDHSYQLKPSEKKILREVARMTPCYFKLDCNDASCIYGHRCPQSRPNRQDCYYKNDCRFLGWGHGIDEKVVSSKMVKG